MKHALLTVLMLIAAPTTAYAQAQCQPAGLSRAQLDALKQANWDLPNPVRRNALARALTECLADPDPALRDGIAFEALSHWLRARQLNVQTMRALARDLDARLSASDPQGFERPFAALVLSEVVRADRIEAYLDADLRRALLDNAIAYFVGVRDYRGFDAQEGWRHGVAHGADLLLQLSLNPAFGRAELERIRDAVAVQVAPEAHFYIYGESERLARPIIFMAQRGLIGEADWTQWFARLPTVGEAAFDSQAGLARRHDMSAFLQTIYLNARLSENTEDDVLLTGAEAALRAMP